MTRIPTMRIFSHGNQMNVRHWRAQHSTKSNATRDKNNSRHRKNGYSTTVFASEKKAAKYTLNVYHNEKYLNRRDKERE